MISSFFLKLFGKKGFIYSVKVFPASTKSIKPIQKYRRLIELHACIVKIFVIMFLFFAKQRTKKD